MAVLTFCNKDETGHKQYITGDAQTAGLIHGMKNVEYFILRTNYVEPVQVDRFYVTIIITIVPGQYDINSLVTFIKSKIQKVGFGQT